MKTKERTRVYIPELLAAVAIPLAVGAFSFFLTADDMAIYDTMDRPPLSPPGWVFPIVWTILYVLMGIASYLVCFSDAEPARKRSGLRVYAIQLAMNLFWCTLFFTYARYLVSLIWLLVMWILILICAIRFKRMDRTAGLLMMVLFLWTTFAAYLNLVCYLQSVRSIPGIQ